MPQEFQARFCDPPGWPGDVPTILRFVKALAEFERLADKVTATEAILANSLFGPRAYAECLIAEVGAAPAGIALFFHNFSTFTGKPGLYLEDIFVAPEYRSSASVSLSSAKWRKSLSRAIAHGSNGRCSTGMSARSGSIAGSGPSRCRNGRCKD